MNNEFDPLTVADADLEKPRCLVGPDQHREIVESEDSNGVLVCMDHVDVGDAMTARARQNDGIHNIKLS